jgi:hypothetical protein
MLGFVDWARTAAGAASDEPSSASIRRRVFTDLLLK